jgi:hypothetical protein
MPSGTPQRGEGTKIPPLPLGGEGRGEGVRISSIIQNKIDHHNPNQRGIEKLVKVAAVQFGQMTDKLSRDLRIRPTGNSQET